jgi:mono/diheme cytochrome c family protein
MNARTLHAVAARCRRAAGAVCLASWVAFLADAPARADMGIFNPPTLSAADGRQVYEQICQGCHMPGGLGAVGAGHYPALAKNPALGSAQYMALTILAGRRNMPAFGAKHAAGFNLPPVTLSEAQVAAVINYIRTHFGNRYSDSITAAEVAALDRSAH